MRIEPLLRSRETRQARDPGEEVDVFPLGVEASGVQSVEAAKQILDKA